MTSATTEGETARETWISRVFRVSVTLKGLDGILEIIGGVLLLFVPVKRITGIVQVLTQHEIDHDPTDFIATHLRDGAAALTGSATLFAAIYLLVHGIVKVVLVVAVLRGYTRAYPWMIGFLIAFVIYQAYELILHVTVGLMLLTLFDLLIIGLTVHEYRLRRREAAAEPQG
ncbi:MAG: DUF2127 domain-containing protein [Actinomycetota bacterium]|nr:DUF2127 domain-containing protein [Actinomycetota bacterium]